MFEEQRLEDEEELSSPEGVNLTSHLDVFHALFRKVCQCLLNLFMTFFIHYLNFDFFIFIIGILLNLPFVLVVTVCGFT